MDYQHYLIYEKLATPETKFCNVVLFQKLDSAFVDETLIPYWIVSGPEKETDMKKIKFFALSVDTLNKCFVEKIPCW